MEDLRILNVETHYNAEYPVLKFRSYGSAVPIIWNVGIVNP